MIGINIDEFSQWIPIRIHRLDALQPLANCLAYRITAIGLAYQQRKRDIDVTLMPCLTCLIISRIASIAGIGGDVRRCDCVEHVFDSKKGVRHSLAADPAHSSPDHTARPSHPNDQPTALGGRMNAHATHA